MYSSKTYLLKLIESVRLKPCLWDFESEKYKNKKEKEENWKIVVNEVQNALQTEKLTVLDVKWSWHNLHKTYVTCQKTGNKSNFELYEELNFLGPHWMWYYRINAWALYIRENSRPNHLIILRFLLNVVITIILHYVFYYDIMLEKCAVPSNLPSFFVNYGRVFNLLFTIPTLICALPTPTIEFYSPRKIPLLCPFLAIFIAAVAINKTTFYILSTAPTVVIHIVYVYEAMIHLSMMNIIAVITSSIYKKPFPPSKLNATISFVYNLCFAYFLHVINSVIKSQHWIFNVIPIWVVCNAALSALFCNYLWSNADSLFPLFNENPFEMVTKENNIYHIEFKQKPRQQKS